MTGTCAERRHNGLIPFRHSDTDLPSYDPVHEAGRLAGLISHELRLPLTAIVVFAELLAQDGGSEERRADLHHEICLAARQMNDLIDSLIELANGRATLRPAAGNVESTLRQAIRMVAVRPEFDHVTVAYSHYGLTQGWFDFGRLTQAVANLVLNACEAAAIHSGRVEVVTIGSRHRLDIEVWDNGPGVPDAIRESLFQPFVSYGKQSGCGLGLAIVRKIVDDHGGQVYLARSDEAGTMFKITLPSVLRSGALPEREAGASSLHAASPLSGARPQRRRSR